MIVNDRSSVGREPEALRHGRRTRRERSDIGLPRISADPERGFAAAALLCAIPAACVLAEAILAPQANPLHLLGKWFVLWGLGVHRLAVGLARRLRWDGCTTADLGIADPRLFLMLSRSGAVDILVGLLGLSTIFVPDWLASVAAFGMLFFCLATTRNMGMAVFDRAAGATALAQFLVACALALYVAAILPA